MLCKSPELPSGIDTVKSDELHVYIRIIWELAGSKDELGLGSTLVVQSIKLPSQ